eukprot:6504197-Prymnesium_polylepis.1
MVRSQDASTTGRGPPRAHASHPAMLMLCGSDPFVASIRAAQRKVITIANEMIQANVQSTASRATAAVVRTFLYACVLTW